MVNSVCSFNQKAVQNKHTVTNLLQLNKRQNSKLLQEVKEAHFQTNQTSSILTHWYEEMAICYHINICL